MFVLKLAIFETGIAEIHDMMTFNVPRGLKFVAVSVVLMACITLYFQAAVDFYMDLRAAFALFGGFLVTFASVLASVGLALPLKAVVAGTHRAGPSAQLSAQRDTGREERRVGSFVAYDAAGGPGSVL